MTRFRTLTSTALTQPLPNAIDLSQLRLQIVYKATASLKPPARQARVHSRKQIEAIAANVKEQGFLQPVLIDEDGVIIDGVARWEAAKLLTLDEIATICVTHLSRQQIKRIRLTLNRMADLAEWDMETLAIELNEIISIEPESMPLLGWEPPVIDLMISQLTPSPAAEDPGDAPVETPAWPAPLGGSTG